MSKPIVNPKIPIDDILRYIEEFSKQMNVNTRDKIYIALRDDGEIVL